MIKDKLALSNKEDTLIKGLYISLFNWYSFFKSKLLLITFVAFLGGVLGFCYAWVQPINYTSKITFVVEEAKSGISNLGGLASLAGQFGVDVSGASGGGLFSGDNILLFLKSMSLSKKVMLSPLSNSSNKTIADKYAEIYKLKENWEANPKIGKINFPPTYSSNIKTRLQDSLLNKMIENVIESQLKINRIDKKAGFIEVSVTMEDEELAEKFCNKLVSEAVESYVSLKVKRQKATVDNLQRRVDSIAYLLNNKTIAGASLQNRATTMDINPLFKTNTSIAVETTIRDKTMLATIFASVTQNLELAKFTLSQETPVIQIVDSSVLPLKRIKKSRLIHAIVFSFFSGFFFSLFLFVRIILKESLA